jgi:hypothetical protein
MRLLCLKKMLNDVIQACYVHTGSMFKLAGWEKHTYNIMHKLLGRGLGVEAKYSTNEN